MANQCFHTCPKGRWELLQSNTPPAPRGQIWKDHLPCTHASEWIRAWQRVRSSATALPLGTARHKCLLILKRAVPGSAPSKHKVWLLQARNKYVDNQRGRTGLAIKMIPTSLPSNQNTQQKQRPCVLRNERELGTSQLNEIKPRSPRNHTPLASYLQPCLDAAAEFLS